MGRARSFPCSWDTCEKVFNRKSDLCRHFRIHTNERPYCCDFPNCNKSFIQRSALTVHTRTHTGEKPHVCDIADCRKAFSDSSSLARHRRIHTGKRPYKCQEPACDRSFCRKTTLTKHQNRSHQPDTPSTPSSVPPQDAPPYHSASPVPPQIQIKQEYHDQQPTTYQGPVVITQTYPQQQLKPQIQPQIQQQQQQPLPFQEQQLQYAIQCISAPEPVPVQHTEVGYVGFGLVMSPQVDRFDASVPVREVILQSDAKYMPQTTMQGAGMGVPSYIPMYQVPYQPEIGHEKPMQVRMLDPYQGRAWEFVGLEG